MEDNKKPLKVSQETLEALKQARSPEFSQEEIDSIIKNGTR